MSKPEVLMELATFLKDLGNRLAPGRFKKRTGFWAQVAIAVRDTSEEGFPEAYQELWDSWFGRVSMLDRHCKGQWAGANRPVVFPTPKGGGVKRE